MGGHGSKPVWDDKVPDMRGKTALITGANSGLGLETARRLAASGATVVLACRNEQRGAAAVEELKRAQPDASVSFLQVPCSVAPVVLSLSHYALLPQLDLCSQKSVKQAAASFKKAHKNLHLLINNAAVRALALACTRAHHCSLPVGHPGMVALVSWHCSLRVSYASSVIFLTAPCACAGDGHAVQAHRGRL